MVALVPIGDTGKISLDEAAEGHSVDIEAAC
jgi:hypothetical protein